jgi:hypothetical protein
MAGSLGPRGHVNEALLRFRVLYSRARKKLESTGTKHLDDFVV